MCALQQQHITPLSFIQPFCSDDGIGRRRWWWYKCRCLIVCCYRPNLYRNMHSIKYVYDGILVGVFLLLLLAAHGDGIFFYIFCYFKNSKNGESEIWLFLMDIKNRSKLHQYRIFLYPCKMLWALNSSQRKYCKKRTLHCRWKLNIDAYI